jgi:hypothetical protein
MRMAAFCLGLLLARAAAASEDGGQPMAFTKLAGGARPAAMGQASAALAGDAYGQPRNPALLATLKEGRAGSQLALLPGGRDLQNLTFGRPFDPGSAWSYGLFYSRSGFGAPLERRVSNTPDPDSTFSESASVIGAGVAAWLWPGRVAAGINVKLLNQSLGDASGGGFSGDGGLFWRTGPHLDLGLGLQDVASRLGWNTGLSENLAPVIRAGARLRGWDDRASLGLEMEKGAVQDWRLRLGAEWWPLPQKLALRAGWNQGLWSLGTGLRARLVGWQADAGLDYALVQDLFSDGALQHRFSLDLGFSL